MLEAVWRVMKWLRRLGVHMLVEHIYGEFNKLADDLANRAVDTSSSSTWTAPSRTSEITRSAVRGKRT